MEKPDLSIRGAPIIQKFQVLPNRRHIVTQDSEGTVSIYDALTAQVIERIPNSDFDSQVKKRSDFLLYIPSWFTVDLKIGMVMIHLDESDALSAWLSAKYSGLTCPTGDSADQKGIFLASFFY